MTTSMYRKMRIGVVHFKAFPGIETGEGLPVVFLHAGVCDKRMWESQMTMVADEGWHAIAYDRRGYGETTTPDEGFSHLEDLEAVLDALGIHAAIVVGASIGGMIRLSRESMASASLAMRRLSRILRRFGPRTNSRPRKMLAQTGMFPASARSW